MLVLFFGLYIQYRTVPSRSMPEQVNLGSSQSEDLSIADTLAFTA